MVTAISAEEEVLGIEKVKDGVPPPAPVNSSAPISQALPDGRTSLSMSALKAYALSALSETP